MAPSFCLPKLLVVLFAGKERTEEGSNMEGSYFYRASMSAPSCRIDESLEY